MLQQRWRPVQESGVASVTVHSALHAPDLPQLGGPVNSTTAVGVAPSSPCSMANSSARLKNASVSDSILVRSNPGTAAHCSRYCMSTGISNRVSRSAFSICNPCAGSRKGHPRGNADTQRTDATDPVDTLRVLSPPPARGGGGRMPRSGVPRKMAASIRTMLGTNVYHDAVVLVPGVVTGRGKRICGRE